MIYFDFQSFSTLLSSVCWWLWEKAVSESGGVSLGIPIAPTSVKPLYTDHTDAEQDWVCAAFPPEGGSVQSVLIE